MLDVLLDGMTDQIAAWEAQRAVGGFTPALLSQMRAVIAARWHVDQDRSRALYAQIHRPVYNRAAARWCDRDADELDIIRHAAQDAMAACLSTRTLIGLWIADALYEQAYIDAMQAWIDRPIPVRPESTAEQLELIEDV